MKKNGRQSETTELGARMVRWILALVLWGGLAGGAIWTLAWLATPHNVPLERVRIDGDFRHTKRVMLQKTLAAQLEGSFFSLDLDRVRSAVESLPWIEQASVRRVWPATLVVRVEERVALARWGGDSVVSPQGEVFRPDPSSVPPGLAILSGPAGSAREVVHRYGWMRRNLQRRGLNILRLELSGRHAWTLELDVRPYKEQF